MEFLIMIGSAFAIIIAVLAVLLPFFVLRIRNELIFLNKQVDHLIDQIADIKFLASIDRKQPNK